MSLPVLNMLFLDLTIILLQLLQLTASTQLALPAATHLRVNRLKSPLSIGSPSPVFSWIVPIINTAAGIEQTGYNIIVTDESSNNSSIIWNSQHVQSNQSINVPYLGRPLQPFKRYSFTIKWSSSNNQTSVGSSSFFGVGPLDEKDWQKAKWVGSDEGTGYLRATVTPIGTTADPIFYAQAYISAPGCATLFINGKNDHATKSGICKWEHWSKRRGYVTVNLLPYLHTESNKKNQFDIMLGHGMWTKYGANSPSPTVLALLYFETQSGKHLYVPTSTPKQDSNASSMFEWKHSATSYIIHDDPFIGAEMNWSWTPNWIDGLPPQSKIDPNASFIVYPMDVAMVIDQAIFLPKSVNYLKNEYGGAVYVYDVGTNIVGTCQVLAGGKGTIHLRHGESLLKNGSLNLNFTGQDQGVKANFQHDTHHVNNGIHNDTANYYRPTYTWYGFQYVSVHVEDPTTLQFNGSSLKNSITCYQMYPDLDSSLRGSVEFGDDTQSNLYGKRLNDVHQIVVTSQLGNIVQYAPTDCPTREKHFWLGDALDTAEEAFYNLGPDVVGIYSNFIQIVHDEQTANHNIPGVVPTKSHQYYYDRQSLILHQDISLTPQRACGKGGVQQGCTDISWTSAYPLISDGISQHFGDDLMIHKHYHSMTEYMENLYDSSNDTLPAFFTWGDWCSMQPRSIATPSTGPPAASGNWIFSTDAMARMASIVKQPQSVVMKWINRSRVGRKKWHELYYKKEKGAYGYVSNNDFVLQTLTSLPLALENVVPKDLSSTVNDNYANDFVNRNYHGTYGSVGSKYVFNQLTSNGNHTIAMKLATQTTYPSYGYWISQGATSCWENWSGVSDSQHPPQPTHNHIFLCGGVSEWMYKHIVGIKSCGKGFERVCVRPFITPLVGPSSATGKVGTNYGQIKVSWSRDIQEKRITLSVTTPKPASIALPTIDADVQKVVVTASFAGSDSAVVWQNGVFQEGAVDGVVSGVGEQKNKDGTQRVVLGVIRGSYTFVLQYGVRNDDAAAGVAWRVATQNPPSCQDKMYGECGSGIVPGFNVTCCAGATCNPAQTGMPPVCVPRKEKQMNVLFLMVDDLRPEFNQAYGQNDLVTPNLDRFTKSSLTFDRAYVQFSHCSPSRNSFMSGRSPQVTGVYNFLDDFRESGKNWTTMPQFFKQKGYYVSGGGKLYHPNHPLDNDMPHSWDHYYFANGDDNGCRKNETIYDNVCPSMEQDEMFYDNQLALKCISEMERATKMNKPFFIGAGFRRPHRVWHVPRRFYDMYANNGTYPTNISLAKHKTEPVGMPELAWIHNAWPPLSVQQYNQTNPIPDDIASLGKWGYYSAVSFTDYNVGLVLDAVDRLRLSKNTIIVFSGDHGWQLGEHGLWCKRSNFEVGVRVPFMIRSPKHPKSYGQRTTALVESLDFYRTLAALATGKGDTVENGVEGMDLSPLFEEMNGLSVGFNGSSSSFVRNFSFSQMARCPQTGLGPMSACNQVKRVNIKYMGYTVRTNSWRYTAWLDFNGTKNRAEWSLIPSSLHGEELYTHIGDKNENFDEYENENVASYSQYKNVRDELLNVLKEKFE